MTSLSQLTTFVCAHAKPERSKHCGWDNIMCKYTILENKYMWSMATSKNTTLLSNDQCMSRFYD